MSLRCRECQKERPGKIGSTVSWLCSCGADNRVRWDTEFTYRCNSCGQKFKAWATAQRHADGHKGGARLDLILDGARRDLFPEDS